MPENDDSIVLDGQTYLMKGPLVGKPISEFESGIKIGQATYDDRTHAFYLVLDDFSGGFGHRFLDIREALGTHYDNPGGVDLRRARHVTLPPLQDLTAQVAVTFLSAVSGPLTKAAMMSSLGGDDYLHVGIGNLMKRIASTRTTLDAAFAFTFLGRQPDSINRLLEFVGSDDAHRMYAFTMNAGLTARYWTSADPGAASPTWTERTKTIWDAIVWDDKIVAQQQALQFIFSTDGLNWNIDDPNDGEPVWRPRSACRFVGVALAPWGSASAIYFIDYGDGRLYVLDFYIRKAYPVAVGDNHYLIDGIVWNGTLVVTDGWNIWQYTPGPGETVRRIGLVGKEGFPESLQLSRTGIPAGTGGLFGAPQRFASLSVPDSMRLGQYRISGLIDGGANLFAVAERIADPSTLVGAVTFVYNGIGWTQYGAVLESDADFIASDPVTGIVDRFPVNIAGVETPSSRALALILGAPNSTPTPFARAQISVLPIFGNIPVADLDEFSSGPASFVTGWIDGGFSDIDGTLYHIKDDALNKSADETIQVEYRLDNNEGASWTSLGLFNGTVDRLEFDATNQAGVEFRTVQFRITLLRGGTTTKTPELRALTLVYAKKAALRTAWVGQIDVSRMVSQREMVDTNDDGTPDTPATLQNVWEKLERTWAKQTLVQLVIPNLKPEEENLRVQLADMPVTVDGWRDPNSLKGTVDLTAIETVSP